MDNRGITIAEGDILVLCIRLFSELLIGRYGLPQPDHANTLLSRHASGVFSRCRDLLSTFQGGHRDDAFNNLILPQSELAVTALGHALAHSCALDAGVPTPLLELFECYIVRLDSAWYAEHVGITDDVLRQKEDRAIHEALPNLKAYIDKLDVRRWVTAPILNDEAWNRWLSALPIHTGFERQDTMLYDNSHSALMSV